jgi:hypothetical protein
VLPVFDDEARSPLEKQAAAAIAGLYVLDDEIRISERGFDRDDGLPLDTAEVVFEWSQLVVALGKLEQLPPSCAPRKKMTWCGACAS